MNKQRFVLLLILAAALVNAGCNRGQNAPATTSNPAPAAQPAATPAPPANATATVASSPASSSAVADASAAIIEQNKKLSAIDWAMKQDEVKNDPNGQWASEATSSSSYNDAKGEQAWSAMQAAGPPNVDRYGDDGKAWAPKTPDAGIEWLDLKYAKPVNATEVRIRESCGSGTVVRVELFDELGNAHKIWQGVDPTLELNYFVLKFPPTTYKTSRVKVTLATNVIPGWNEIDAVQLVGK